MKDPVFSGTDACTTERGLEIRRQMFVEGRRFIISSVLSSKGGDTPTKRLLQVIDNDWRKNRSRHQPIITTKSTVSH